MTQPKPQEERKVPWAESVGRARAGLTKSFQGRMEIAEASFEQVPPDGKNAGGRTLAEFAEDAGVEYAALDNYRQVWRWLEEDFRITSEIGFTVALEAMKAGEMVETIVERQKQDPPEGYKRGTVGAHNTARELEGLSEEMRAKRVENAERDVLAAEVASRKSSESAKALRDGDMSDAQRGVLLQTASNTVVYDQETVVALSGDNTGPTDWDDELARLEENS
jgi:hypothetical protein